MDLKRVRGMSGKAGYKGIDFDTWLSERLATPKRRAEFEAGLIALKFGVACCMRREELGLKQKDLEPFGIPERRCAELRRVIAFRTLRPSQSWQLRCRHGSGSSPPANGNWSRSRCSTRRPKLPNESARFDALTPSATGYQYPTTTSTPHSRPRPHLVPSPFQGEG